MIEEAKKRSEDEQMEMALKLSMNTTSSSIQLPLLPPHHHSLRMSCLLVWGRDVEEEQLRMVMEMSKKEQEGFGSL